MIRVHVFRQGREATDVDIDSLSEVRTEKGTVVWVDMTSPTEPELAKIAEEFGVASDTLRECVSERGGNAPIHPVAALHADSRQ